MMSLRNITFALGAVSTVSAVRLTATDIIDDAGDWVSGAVDDASDWTEGAANDVADWTVGAVDDAGDLLAKEPGKILDAATVVMTADYLKKLGWVAGEAAGEAGAQGATTVATVAEAIGEAAEVAETVEVVAATGA